MRRKTESGKNAVQSGKQVATAVSKHHGAGRKARPAVRKSLSGVVAPGDDAGKAIAIRLKTEEARQPHRETLSESKIIAAFDALGITKKLNDDQKKLFLAVAMEFQLNPLRREIHAVRMGGDDEDGKAGTLVPVVGYEVYIDRAEETGRLEYWHLEEEGEIYPEDWRKSTYKVTFIGKRRDWGREFRWPVRYVEAVGLRYDAAKRCQVVNSMWRKRGHFMTQKCTIGQGFRLLFREILRGMPYIDAEIENAENGKEHEEEKGDLRPPQALPTAATPAPLPAPAQTAPADAEPAAPASSPKAEASAPGPYGQIMNALNEKVKSKEGPLVALFGNQEKMEWKAKADMSRGKADEIKAALEELLAVAEARRKKIKGEV